MESIREWEEQIKGYFLKKNFNILLLRSFRTCLLSFKTCFFFSKIHKNSILERYIFVGKLLKPGEEPSIYPENEDITTNVADN